MLEIYLNECENELFYANECINSIIQIDPYYEIFEADANANIQNANVNNQQNNNGAIQHIKNALQALMNGIKTVISNIKNFFANTFGNKRDESVKQNFAIAKQKNPNIANSKVRMLDTNRFNQQTNSLLNEAEGVFKSLASGVLGVNVDGVINKITSFCSNGANAFMISVGAEVALQAASSSKELANVMVNSLNNDQKLQQSLMDAMGKSEFNKFNNDLNSFTKKVSLRQAILRLKGYNAKSVEDSVSTVYNQCENLIKGVVGLSSTLKENPNKVYTLSGVAKTGKYLFDNRKTVSEDLKNINKNSGRIGKRIFNNKEITDTAAGAAKDLYNYKVQKRKAIKQREKQVKKAFKQDQRLQKSKNKSDQSLIDSLTGQYDPKSNISGTKVDSAARQALGVLNRVRH